MQAHEPVIERGAPSLIGRRVCITGGAGFIGGHLAETLLAIGAVVTVIDDLSNADHGTIARLLSRHPDHARFIHASILDDRALRRAIEGAEVVFHAAALSSVPRSLEDPCRSWTVNASGTVAVLEASRSAGVRRVVYSASSSAYGDAPALPKVETMPPDPRSPYAASKLAGEQACAAWARSFDVDTVSLRYFNVFGPRQAAGSPYAGVVPAFAQAIIDGRPLRIHGDGEQTRDFTPVAGVVGANLLAATAPAPLGGRVLNIGSGARMSINRLAALVAAEAGVSPAIEHGPDRRGDVRDSLASVDAARGAIGYEPERDIDGALRRAVAWYLGRPAREPAGA